MAGFSSMDDLVASITAGKSYRADFNKTYVGGTVVAGRWYDLLYQPGTPSVQQPGNLVRNWDFQGGANGWTLSGGMAYTPATHLITKSGAGNDTITIPVQCTPGLTYQVYCTFGTLTGSGNMTYTLGGTAGANITAAGTTVQDIVMGTSNANLVISVPSGITATTIDQVVVIKKLQFYPMSDTDLSGCGLWHGGDMTGGETKHLLNMGCWTQVAAAAPAVLMLVDLLGCYPAIDTKVSTLQTLTKELTSNGTFTGNANNWTLGAGWAYNSNAVRRTAAAATNLTQMIPTTPKCPYTVVYTVSARSAGGVTVSLGGTAGTQRTADGTYTETITPADSTSGLVFTPTADAALDIDTVSVIPTIPRYTDGSGVRMYLCLSKIDNGTGTPTFSVSYSNPAYPSGGRTLGASPAVLASAIQGHIYHSGVAAGSMGPFLPLQNGDAAVTSVESIQMGAASGSQGYSTLMLCRPLAALPIMTAFVASERDFLNQLPSLPRIYDGAHLAFLVFAGGVISNVSAYQGYCDFAWS
jgi:hypothetical protein